MEQLGSLDRTRAQKARERREDPEWHSSRNRKVNTNMGQEPLSGGFTGVGCSWLHAINRTHLETNPKAEAKVEEVTSQCSLHSVVQCSLRKTCGGFLHFFRQKRCHVLQINMGAENHQVVDENRLTKGV